MKRILLTVMILAASFRPMLCQVYYDSAWYETNKEKAVYYKLVEKAKDNRYVEKYFLMNDTLIYFNNMLSVRPEIKDGKCFKYYPSGKLQYITNYSHGLLQGEVIGYYENGSLKRQDIYENDSFISGKCFTKEGKDTTCLIFQKPPKYHGKNINFNDFSKSVMQHVIYPSEAQDKNLSGKVIVSFEISSYGNLVNIKVVQSPSHLLSDAVINVLMSLDSWEPAIYEEKYTNFRIVLPCEFHLKN